MIADISGPIGIHVADYLFDSTGPIQQSPVLTATDIPEYALCELKMLHGLLRHALTNQADRIVDVCLLIVNYMRLPTICRNLFGVVSHLHISLLDIAQLLPELELSSCYARDQNRFQIFPSIFRRPGIPNVAQKLITHTGCKTIEKSACRLFQGREVSLCRLGCCIISSINITPIPMPE